VHCGSPCAGCILRTGVLQVLTQSVEACNVVVQMPANPRHLILNLLLGAGGDALTAGQAVA
jgi:hypothetical protein